MTGLPLKSKDEFIPDNFRLAYRRFMIMVSTKLDNDPQLKRDYKDVFESYERDDMIEEVKDSGIPGKIHYLPHHPVVRSDKETTKVRPVFDASSKEKGGKSLNDFLHPGPCLLSKIYDVIIRLCFKKFVLIADIRQAFLNIEICEENRDLLRFLFFDKYDDSKFSVYRFKRGCFGVTSLPFIMCATIRYHMNCLKLKNPENSLLVEQFLRDLYMDDVVTTVNSFQDGVVFYNFARDAMNLAGFELRKWYSNSAEMMKYMKCEDEDNSKLKKILGMVLNSEDEFLFDLSEMVAYADQLPVTKRSILRFGAKFFDVPGYISPVVIIAKIYFQKVCLDNSNWDEELHGGLRKGWMNYLKELRNINCIRFLPMLKSL